MKKNFNGITLIALILTVIVLLILAAVTISAVKGDGIINYAKNSTDEYTQKQTEENTILQGYSDYINKNISGEDPIDYLKSKLKNFSKLNFEIVDESLVSDDVWMISKETGIVWQVQSTLEGYLTILYKGNLYYVEITQNEDTGELEEVKLDTVTTWEEGLLSHYKGEYTEEEIKKMVEDFKTQYASDIENITNSLK